MEQQNQQPMQEKTESKPPIKTNRKFIAIVGVFVVLTVGGILLLRGFQPETLTPQDTIPPQVRKSFATQAECERQTGYRCDFVNCDINCPVGFQKGWSATDVKLEKEQVDTSTWQIYRNDEFGFEVKYSEKFVHRELPKSDYYLTRVLFEDQSNSSKNIFIDVIVRPDSPESIDRLGIVVELEKSSLVGHTTDRIDSERAIEKDGYEGVELEYVIFSGMEEISFKTILIEQSDYIYKVNSPTEFADQILSTFRFVE